MVICVLGSKQYAHGVSIELQTRREKLSSVFHPALFPEADLCELH